MLFSILLFPLRKHSKCFRATSETTFSRRFEKRQELAHLKGREKVNAEANCPIM